LLRLVAIGLTMLVHTPSITERVFLLRPFRNGFWLGVDLFMLISGWLLGGQLLREAAGGRVLRLRFYAKRWLRTLPPYYAMLALLYWSHNPQFGGPLPTWQVLTHVTFLQIYIGPTLYMVSWSLCVEEHFYLALPGVVALVGKSDRTGRMLGLTVAALILAVALRAVAFWQDPLHSDVPLTSYYRTDGLWLGFAFSWIHLHAPRHWKRLGKYSFWLFFSGLALTATVMYATPAAPSAWRFIGVPTVGTVAMALAFIACVHDQSPFSRMSFRGLQYLGELTFAIYLVHDVMPSSWLGDKVAGGGILAVARRLGLVFGCSILLHHGVERPALSLRRRLLARWPDSARRASAE